VITLADIDAFLVKTSLNQRCYYAWRLTPAQVHKVRGEPITRDEYQRRFGDSIKSLDKWDDLYINACRALETPLEEPTPEPKPKNLDPDLLQSLDQKSIYAFILQNPTPQNLRLLADMKGWTKKQEETKLEFTADDIARAADELVRRLQELVPQSCRGTCPLLAKSALLYDKVCVDSEPEHREGSEVATLELSDGLDDGIPDLSDSPLNQG
jgi:hypothetical protein